MLPVEHNVWHDQTKVVHDFGRAGRVFGAVVVPVSNDEKKGTIKFPAATDSCVNKRLTCGVPATIDGNPSTPRSLHVPRHSKTHQEMFSGPLVQFAIKTAGPTSDNEAQQEMHLGVHWRAKSPNCRRALPHCGSTQQFRDRIAQQTLICPEQGGTNFWQLGAATLVQAIQAWEFKIGVLEIVTEAGFAVLVAVGIDGHPGHVQEAWQCVSCC